MIPEIGHFGLVLAFAVAAAQIIFSAAAAKYNDAVFASMGRRSAYLFFALASLAFGALVYAYAVSDFSVLNVAENSHSDKPLIYKITGAWGNHEGSMLLWVLILAAYGAAFAATARTAPATLHALTLSVQGAVSLAFLAFILFTSNPFERLAPAPADGAGLNPLLQDIGLAIHPPFLYLGYVGFSLPFSFAVAALIRGRADTVWASLVRPWALAAWSLLTIGIALGSWWAYYELGWGGWWAWDPVENASFMPWLAGTALIHSIRVVERRDALKSWAVLLAIMTFSLSLIGTFLVRSGVLTSVHAFAVDPTRGVFILMILFAAIGGSLSLFAWRAPSLQATGAFAPVSRESALLANNVLLVSACATVFVGTFYPLFVDILSGERLSVGAPYFNAVFVPLASAMMALAAIGVLLPWKKADLAAALQRLAPAAMIALGAGVIAGVLAAKNVVIGGAAIALIVWLIAGTLTEFAERVKLLRAPMSETFRRARRLPRSAWGSTVAHTGLAIFALGVAGISLWQSDQTHFMQENDVVKIAGFDVALKTVKEIRGPNYIAERAIFEARKPGRAPFLLTGERRFYPVRGMQTTEAAIRPVQFGDLYISTGEPQAGKGWPVRLYYNPLVAFLWIGSAITAFGGALALTDLGRRPAPRRSRPVSTEAFAEAVRQS